MRQMNALDIQKTLNRMNAVSVPWIQQTYEFSYQEAKLFLEQLIVRGWIEEEPVGVQYKVIKDNLCLRKIKRTEVNALIENITSDCTAALKCIQNKNATGATLGELVAAVRGEEDANQALDVLTQHMLIYCNNGKYFSRVSQATIQVLMNMVRMKRVVSRRFSEEDTDNKDLVKLFDVLFGVKK